MSSGYVLDASAMMAMLMGEPGGDFVRLHLTRSSMSTVNVAEVFSRLEEQGPEMVHDGRNVFAILRQIHDFSYDQAQLAAGLRPKTREFGLSLGDRACLALAMMQDVEAVTADRAWMSLKIGCKVKLIR